MTKILGLAPMDGFTDNSCRNIAQDIRNTYGEKEIYDFFLWTEFMTADGFIRNPEGVRHHLLTSPSQNKVIAQIFGGNREILFEAIQKVQTEYKDIFYGIELNMGCPANNIMKSGGGASLLKDKEETLDIIKGLRNIIPGHFSIKTRTGLNNEDKQAQFDFLKEASKYVNMITIHGRTVVQGYGPNPDREFIYELKRQLPNQTIIGNGGITSYEEIKNYIGNLDGVMIGQAAIGNPRVFTPHTPTIHEKYETIIKHMAYIKEEHTTDESLQRSLMEFRKHLYSYVKGIPGSKEFKTTCNSCKEYIPLLKYITEFFNSL